MAGELLFRILDRQAFETLVRHGPFSWKDVAKTFLDGGDYSLAEPSGEKYAVVDGPAFYIEAPWMYENHDKLEKLPLGNVQTATLLIPRELVVEWRQRLAILPMDGEVARDCPAIRDALIEMMEAVIESDGLSLTVASLL